MPDQKMTELCARIAAEKDARKLIALTDELLKLLDEEQVEIKANIAKRLSQVVTGTS